jgi:integrase/recombinase XerD
MRNTAPLSRWDAAASAYLSSRRALGRKYIPEEHVLKSIRAFLARGGAADLSEPLFDQWRRRPHLSTSTRLRWERTVYKFCVYRRRTERRCFLPDPLSFVRLRPYPLPMIIERRQVVRLLAVASLLKPAGRSPIRAAVMRMAVILLYTAGLRRGEVTRLTLGDADSSAGVLRIPDSKFQVSMGATVTQYAHGATDLSRDSATGRFRPEP